jgi:hypothetical protein
MSFDGTNPAPTAPHNELSRIPAPGSPGHDAYLEAEAKAREPWISGNNPARAATLAADKAAADAQRAKDKATANALAQVVAKAAAAATLKNSQQ